MMCRECYVREIWREGCVLGFSKGLGISGLRGFSIKVFGNVTNELENTGFIYIYI